MASRTLIVVPARFGSERLPGKPLAMLAGLPLIAYVLQSVCCDCEICESRRDYDVVVATDDTRVADTIRALRPDVRVEMTPVNLESGTDRVAYVYERMAATSDYDIVVNWQGDMPWCRYDTWVKPCIDALKADPALDMATPVASIPYVTSTFTRSHTWQHVGVYAYRPAALMRFYEARNKKLLRKMEIRKRLEQLRAVALGMNIKTIQIEAPPPVEVNNVADHDNVHFIAASAQQVGEDFDEDRQEMDEDDLRDALGFANTVH